MASGILRYPPPFRGQTSVPALALETVAVELDGIDQLLRPLDQVLDHRHLHGCSPISLSLTAMIAAPLSRRLR